MPPIPTFSEDLIASITRRQKDLSEFQIPRLRSCEGPLSLQQNLAAEVREDIDHVSHQVEALDLLIDDQPSEKSKAELRYSVEGFKQALTKLRLDSRAALLASKKLIDSRTKSRRDELLASNAVNEKVVTSEKNADDALMKANNDVTDALRRTMALMQGELERSVLTSQMLDTSTASLRSTSSAHDTITNLMGTSKQLVTALEKADWLDRMIILAAFAFFVLVVLFVLKQRIVDRGLRIAFWWTRFIPDFSGDAALLRAEEGSKLLSSELLTSTATIATLTLASALTVSSSTSGVLSSDVKESGVTLEEVANTTDGDLHPTSSLTHIDDAVRTAHEEMHVEL